MDDSNKREFKELMDGLSEYYQREKLSAPALQIYFAAMARFTLTQIKWAITRHVQDPSTGQFYPKVADVVRLVEGGDITTDEILAEARLAKTPLGILCRIQIGTWDLTYQTDMRYLKQRAEECLYLLPEWKRKAATGDYTDHEISIMLKHGVDPVASLYEGLPPPSNRQALAARAKEIEQTPRHQFLLEKIEEEADKDVKMDPEVAKFIAEEMAKTSKLLGKAEVEDVL